MSGSTQLRFYIPNLGFFSVVFLLLLALSLLSRLSNVKSSAREPPNIPQRVPYFGHVIGMLQYGLRYFDIIRFGPKPNFSILFSVSFGC
jgi:hypothetical protein